jgi:hypothetical protein
MKSVTVTIGDIALLIIAACLLWALGHGFG